MEGAEYARLPFSILGRIGGDATSCSGWSRSPRAKLSVSSVGSEAMQLRVRLLWSFPPVRLSVSSVGSEAMQLLRRGGCQRRHSPFSILGRIGGDATLPRRWSGPCVGFSVSSVGSEAMQPTLPNPKVVILPHFQYPRSDRRRCNLPPGADEGAVPRFFSILGRIGGDATIQPDAPGAESTRFQYPRSDRRRCNGKSQQEEPDAETEFSVSSVGSEAMQRP